MKRSHEVCSEAHFYSFHLRKTDNDVSMRLQKGNRGCSSVSFAANAKFAWQMSCRLLERQRKMLWISFSHWLHRFPCYLSNLQESLFGTLRLLLHQLIKTAHKSIVSVACELSYGAVRFIYSNNFTWKKNILEILKKN